MMPVAGCGEVAGQVATVDHVRPERGEDTYWGIRALHDLNGGPFSFGRLRSSTSITALLLVASLSYPLVGESTPATASVAPNALRTCDGDGAGGWKFRTKVSDSDGLMLEESSLNGRMYTRSVSAPYLEGFGTVTQIVQAANGFTPEQTSESKLDTKLELTPKYRSLTSAPPGVTSRDSIVR
jgi:hypothetical protein